MRVAIVGSSQLWITPEVLSSTIALMLSLPPETRVNVRARVHLGRKPEPSSSVEGLVVALAERLGLHVGVFQAEGNDRGEVFRRDWRIVAASDRVIAYFAPGQEMAGGTGHVVYAALQRDVPVEAWACTATGLRSIGADDGDPVIRDTFERLDVLRSWNQEVLDTYAEVTRLSVFRERFGVPPDPFV